MSEGNSESSPGVLKQAANYGIVKPYQSAAQGGITWVIAAVFLYAIDWIVLGFNGIDFHKFIEVISSDYFIIKTFFLNVTAIAIIIAKIIFTKNEDNREILNFSIAVIFTDMILHFSYTLATIIHLIIAWSMAIFLFQKSRSKGDSFLLLVGLLFVDFFASSFHCCGNMGKSDSDQRL